MDFHLYKQHLAFFNFKYKYICFYYDSYVILSIQKYFPDLILFVHCLYDVGTTKVCC